MAVVSRRPPGRDLNPESRNRDSLTGEPPRSDPLPTRVGAMTPTDALAARHTGYTRAAGNRRYTMNIEITSSCKPSAVDQYGRLPAQEWTHGIVTFDNGTTAELTGRGTQWHAVSSDGIRGQGSTPENAANDLYRSLEDTPSCTSYPERCASCGPDYLTDTGCYRWR